MHRTQLPSAEAIREAFDYDPETGVLSWRARPVRPEFSRTDKAWNTAHAGKPTGCPNGGGHLRVLWNGVHYVAHRLIWKWWYGEEPPEIDHEDLNGTNNRVGNLREATHSGNVANGPLRADNRSGFKGVHQRGKRWSAALRKDGVLHWLGTFSTPEAAHAAYCEAAKGLHGRFFRAS